MKQKNCHICLLVNNAPSHIFDEKILSNVEVVFLEPNMTSRVQPLDAGIIRAWKAHYRRLYIRRALERDGDGELDIWKIDQLEGMHLAEEAWRYISAETIKNCWAHTEIISPRGPDGRPLLSPGPVADQLHATDPAAKAIEKLREATSKLNIRCIAEKDRMSLKEIIEVPGEEVTEQEWTEDDIVEQTRAVFQDSNGVEEDAGESDGDDDPLMTPTQALSAMKELDRLFSVSGSEYTAVSAALKNAIRAMRLDRQTSMTQNTLSSFFQSQAMKV